MVIRFNRLLSLLLLVLALVGAAEIPRHNMRLTAQVAGIALDESDGQLKATFELYDTSVDQPIGKKRQVVTSTGETIEQCLKNARASYGKELFIQDAAALIIDGRHHNEILKQVFLYYSQYKNDQMALPVFFTLGQSAGEIFEGEGEVISMHLAASVWNMKKTQTIKDLMNGTGQRVMVRGKGSYEILS